MNETKRPNILFIMYDQQRYDCVEPSGIFPVKTPNIKRIADNGAYFENCYTPIPVCCPARQTLFVGRRPEAYGGLWNPHIVFPIRDTPDCDRYTQRIKDSGYNTAYVGLWEADPVKSPLDYGFDSYVGRADINRMIAEKHPDVKYTNGYFGEPNPIPLEDAYTHMTAKLACERLDELMAKDEPWYLHIDSPEPHLPCRPSAPFDTMYDPDEIPEWGTNCETFEGKPYIQKQQLINWELENKTWDDWKHTVAMYYGIVSQYDDAIGRILDKLEEGGQLENTIIVYTTDHGDMCGGHRLIDKHYNMYEDITHIPCTIRWDGHIVPGRYTGYMYQCLDVIPTVLSLAGIDIPEGHQGSDLSSYLTSGNFDEGRDHIVSTYNGQQFGLYCSRMIKKGDLKYVWNLTDIDELYDLSVDPKELTNRIYDESYAPQIAELRKLLLAELERCGDPIVNWNRKQLSEGRIH